MVPKIKLIHHCQNENESIKLQALKDLISDEEFQKVIQRQGDD